jgi:hypothetical protein
MAMKIAVLGTGRLTDMVRAFLRTGYHDGVLVEAEQAEVGLIDLDAYGAQKLVEDWRERYPNRPVIALSLQDPQREGVIWLKKPLRAEELVQALQSVAPPKTKVIVREQPSGSVAQAAAGIAAQNRPSGTRLRRNWAEDAADHYNPADYLQGYLAKAYHQATVAGITVCLETGWEPIIVYPKRKSIWVGGDDKQLHAFCRLPLKTFMRLNREARTVNIRPAPEAELAAPPGPLQPMEAFLWKVAWWNSGGRLPVGLNADQPVRLKRWPNLTRWLCPPEAVRLSALLFQRPLTPARAVELLEVTPAEVFGFVSAASAVGLIELVTISRQEEVKPQPLPKNPSLLRRILQRLVGG